jgi:hypothetical protein
MLIHDSTWKAKREYRFHPKIPYVTHSTSQICSTWLLSHTHVAQPRINMVSKSFALLLTVLALVVGVSSSSAAATATQEQVVPVATTKECVVGDNGECLDTESSYDDSTDPPLASVMDKGCPDRGHIIRCAGKYLDTNQNGKLDRSELDAAIERLPWSVHSIPHIYKVGVSLVCAHVLSLTL